MYGSHSYSHSTGPPHSSPSQPEWRLPPTTQHQQSSWPAGSVAPPPPPPPPPAPIAAPSYHPNTYGSISNISPGAGGSPVLGAPGGLNTTSWGMRYKHHILAPPPLPPRPPSVAEHQHHSPAQVQSPTVGSPDNHKPLPATPGYGLQSSSFENHQQWTTGASHTSQQALAPLLPPPPPAPIPPSYQTQPAPLDNQTWQQPNPPAYAGFPSSQHFEVPSYSVSAHATEASIGLPQSMSPPPPPAQQLPPAEQPWPQTLPSEQFPASTANTSLPNLPSETAPPVPPKTGPNLFPANAWGLGPGTPSDWEHLAPTPGTVVDVEIFEPKQSQPSNSSTVANSLPSQPASFTPESSNRPTVSTPPMTISPTAQPAYPQQHIPQQHHDNGSPVSPSTTPEMRDPPRPVRVDSSGTEYSIISATETSESIDGVIEAWNQPITPQTKPAVEQSRESLASGPETRPSMHESSPVEMPQRKQEFKVPRKEVPSRTATPASSSAIGETSSGRPNTASPQPKPQEPYEDLDSWSKSSLARYVAMLRKEEVADSDEERFKIFTAFMAKETKLREILYNIEPEQKKDQEAPQSLPIPQNSTSPPVESGLIPVQSEEEYDAECSSSNDALRESEEGRYSPGGRPILPRLHTPQPSGLQRSASQPNAFKAKVSRDSSSNAQNPISRATSVPPSMNEKTFSPLATNPPQPIYTPFRYTEGPQRGSDDLTFDRPAYQAYSALRQASAESGRVMSNAPKAPTRNRSSTVTSSVAQKDYNETFIGLIREKSVAYRNKTSRRTSSPPPLPAALKQGKTGSPIDDLRSMVSSPLAKQSESSWHVTTRRDLEKYSDNFSYIREAINTWEAAAKIRRENTDRERMRRQEESEKHIDDLFNEKEIGYADINVLEEEFRQKEARVQLDEERQELDDFVAKVYNPLDERLKGEVSALQDHYESALAQLDHENSKIKDSVTDKYNLSHTMKIVNDIYQKLEIRYYKRLEIALDRERRRKKAERRPLVFMGDSAALKKLDGEFDQMEKRNILEAAKARDDRANRLMDTFDNAIILGLGENQSLLDEVTAKVTRIDSEAIQSSGLAVTEVEQLLKSVFTLVESLRQDSESILHSFGVADTALNNADYSVSVAEARYSNADPEIFRRLDDEKKNEDAKIQKDLHSKMESVRVGPSKIIAKINDLLESLGKTPVVEQPMSSETIPAVHPMDVLLPGPRPPTVTPGPRKPDGDPEHQERLRKALEDAKRRNAARSSS
ncbi:uncharacterized protein CDV56_108600 [Aspergillus thermomutatus]|uniref:Uncharacterized protein n=1 Tax=Aspergillus thermomutatus TaxID=41047 RepID=A0A397I3W0_ASPTH|nr:uncharacterized protein CDV56_108600 [Aspergillus thermomutatus]RHZ67933.1 hypothetical protein CDV56_108600 [Aspergillus thermomutatus]